MKFFFKSYSQNFIVITLSSLIIIALVVILSLGQTARWDILDHIQMADSFEKNGLIYPDYNSEILNGSSVYFPGISFLTIILKKVISDNYLLFALQLLACSVIIIFFYIQYYITKSFIPKYKFESYFYFAAISFIFLNYDWLIYATEFKPDTIAFCGGAIGIIISGVDKRIRRSNFLYFLGIFCTGISIVFKQQYIFFLFGLILFAFINNDFRLRKFVFLSSAVSFGIILLIRFNTNAWFWTVTVLKDDGFLSFKSWLINHYKISINHIIGILILITLIFLNKFFWPTNIIENILKLSRKSIWVYIQFFVFLGGLISSFKIGGNAGNTSFGLVVLLPLTIYFIQFLDIRYLSFLFFIIIFFKVPFLMNDAKNRFNESIEFSNAAKEFINKKNLKILTGSDVYYVTRKFRESNVIVNYSMYSLRDNSNIENQLEKSASKYKFDYVIVENWPLNKEYLRKSGRYKILFENKIGIIAKAIKNTL